MQVARCSVRSTRQAKSLTSERRHTPVLPLLLRAKSASETVRGAPSASPSPVVHSLVRASTSRALGPAPRAAVRRRAHLLAGALVGTWCRSKAASAPRRPDCLCRPLYQLPQGWPCCRRTGEAAPAVSAAAVVRPTLTYGPVVCAPESPFFRYCVAVRVECVSSCVQIASYTPPTQAPQPKGLEWARRAAAGAAKS